MTCQNVTTDSLDLCDSSVCLSFLKNSLIFNSDVQVNLRFNWLKWYFSLLLHYLEYIFPANEYLTTNNYKVLKI